MQKFILKNQFCLFETIMSQGPDIANQAVHLEEEVYQFEEDGKTNKNSQVILSDSQGNERHSQSRQNNSQEDNQILKDEDEEVFEKQQEDNIIKQHEELSQFQNENYSKKQEEFKDPAQQSMVKNKENESNILKEKKDQQQNKSYLNEQKNSSRKELNNQEEVESEEENGKILISGENQAKANQINRELNNQEEVESEEEHGKILISEENQAKNQINSQLEQKDQSIVPNEKQNRQSDKIILQEFPEQRQVEEDQNEEEIKNKNQPKKEKKEKNKKVDSNYKLDKVSNENEAAGRQNKQNDKVNKELREIKQTQKEQQIQAISIEKQMQDKVQSDDHKDKVQNNEILRENDKDKEKEMPESYQLKEQSIIMSQEAESQLISELDPNYKLKTQSLYDVEKNKESNVQIELLEQQHQFLKNKLLLKQNSKQDINLNSNYQSTEEKIILNNKKIESIASNQQILTKYDQTLSEMDQLIYKYTELLQKASSKIEQQTIGETLSKLKSEKETLEKKLKQQRRSKLDFHSILKQNLNEIYQFYSKQTFLQKIATFEKLQHEVNVMNLGKFMYFCRDFKLINLTITMQLCQNLITQNGYTYEVLPIQISKVNKKKMSYAQKQDFLLNKFFLVELFKKCTSLGAEINFEEFQNLLVKMAGIIFQSKLESIQVKKQDQVFEIAPVSLLYQYLGLLTQSEYRKKMQFVGQAFDMRDKIEKKNVEQLKSKLKPLKQEQLASKQMLRQQQEEINIMRRNEMLKLNEISSKVKVTSEEEAQSQQQGKIAINWEHLIKMQADGMVEEFDPKQLLNELDLDDVEDNIYLQEYKMQKEKVPMESQSIGLESGEVQSTTVLDKKVVKKSISAQENNNQLQNSRKIQQKNQIKNTVKAKSMEKKTDENIVQSDDLTKEILAKPDNRLEKFRHYGNIPKPKGSKMNQSFSSQRNPVTILIAIFQ